MEFVFAGLQCVFRFDVSVSNVITRYNNNWNVYRTGGHDAIGFGLCDKLPRKSYGTFLDIRRRGEKSFSRSTNWKIDF